MSDNEKPFGQVAFEAYQGLKSDQAWVNPLPEPDQWDRCAEAVIAAYNARLHKRGEQSVIPSDRRSQFTTMAQAVVDALLDLGAVEFTDWAVHTPKGDEPEQSAASFDFGANAYYIRIALAHAGGAAAAELKPCEELPLTS